MLGRLANLGRNAQNNRILAEYADLVTTRGKETADMIYDIYENAGRFVDPPTTLDQAADIFNNLSIDETVVFPIPIEPVIPIIIINKYF